MPPAIDRQALRQQLLQRRRSFHTSPEFAAAEQAANQHLLNLLQQLEPGSLGAYWALPGEFNPGWALEGAMKASKTQHWQGPLRLALPFARKTPVHMAYRQWAVGDASVRDECGIPSAEGAPMVPEVVLVPCVGYTRKGWRLGYGGGYFDRWMAEHPGVTAVGLAWSGSELAEAQFHAAPHDLPLACIVTELGVQAE